MEQAVVGATPARDARLTRESLDAAFAGPLEPVPLKPGYRIGLGLVAVTTVLLPLIYVGLIAAAGYLVYLHATLNLEIMSGRGGTTWKLIAYLGPLVIGALLVLFMIKPLFARPAKQPEPLRLDPQRFPLLFAFVEHIHRSVRAPAPREIRVDCNVNASAGLRHGLASLGRKDLVLTIGLPLIGGMSLRQLAGVLAHEFGHFAQGSGMALTYVVRSVNGWLYRVVYDRDEWDEKLARASQEWDVRVGIVLLLARLFIWLTRKVLWLLMIIGHAIGTFMLRHMEFDADRYEARLAGSDTFAETAHRLRVLSVGSQRAIGWLSESWTERRLVDDFASLVAVSADTLPAEVVERIKQANGAPQAGVFDTHPPDNERIASAMAERAPGIFRLDAPARSVVDDYDALAREATLAFYATDQGLDVRGGQLVPLQKFVAEQGQKDEADKVAEAYLHGVGNLRRPLPLPAQFPAASASLFDGLAQAREAAEVATELSARLPKPSASDGDDDDDDDDDDDKAAPEPEPDPALLRAVMESVVARLVSGLSLLARDDVAQALPDGAASREEAVRLHGVLFALGACAKRVDLVLDALEHAGKSLEAHQQNQEDRAQFDRVVEALARLDSATAALTGGLSGVAYPFAYAAGTLTLAHYATADLPDLGELKIGALPRAQQVLQRLFVLYQRALARTAVIAHSTEGAARALAHASA